MAKRLVTTSVLSEEDMYDKRTLKLGVLAETDESKLIYIAEQSHKYDDFNPTEDTEDKFGNGALQRFISSNEVVLISDQGSIPSISWGGNKILYVQGMVGHDSSSFSVSEVQFRQIVRAIQEYNGAKAPGDSLIFSERLKG